MDTGLNKSGGEGGIRTLGTGVSPYNGLANRRIRPLCHLSGVRSFSLPRQEKWSYGAYLVWLLSGACASIGEARILVRDS